MGDSVRKALTSSMSVLSCVHTPLGIRQGRTRELWLATPRRLEKVTGGGGGGGWNGGYFAGENFVGGKFRHPWKSQSTQLPHAHPHVQAHAAFQRQKDLQTKWH